MTNIYAIDANGYWTGGARQIAAEDGCPPGWVRASAPNPPNGKVAIINGTGWRYVSETPPVERRLIPKSVVQERCAVIGKLDELMTALLSQPLYFGRWFAPNHPNVYADDPDLLAMLGAAGCTAEQIAEVTAP